MFRCYVGSRLEIEGISFLLRLLPVSRGRQRWTDATILRFFFFLCCNRLYPCSSCRCRFRQYFLFLNSASCLCRSNYQLTRIEAAWFFSILSSIATHGLSFARAMILMITDARHWYFAPFYLPHVAFTILIGPPSCAQIWVKACLSRPFGRSLTPLPHHRLRCIMDDMPRRADASSLILMLLPISVHDAFAFWRVIFYLAAYAGYAGLRFHLRPRYRRRRAARD